MKAPLFLLLIGIVLSSAAIAQKKVPGRFQVGGGLRLNITELTNALDSEFDSDLSQYGLGVNLYGRVGVIVSPVLELSGWYGNRLDNRRGYVPVSSTEWGVALRKYKYRKRGSYAPVGSFWGLEMAHYHREFSPSTITGQTRLDQTFIVPNVHIGKQHMFGDHLLVFSSFHLGLPVFPLSSGARISMSSETKWEYRLQWQCGVSLAL